MPKKLMPADKEKKKYPCAFCNSILKDEKTYQYHTLIHMNMALIRNLGDITTELRLNNIFNIMRHREESIEEAIAVYFNNIEKINTALKERYQTK